MEIYLSFDISTRNTGVSVYFEDEFKFFQFNSQLFEKKNNGEYKKSGGKFDLHVANRNINNLIEEIKLYIDNKSNSFADFRTMYVNFVYANNAFTNNFKTSEKLNTLKGMIINAFLNNCFNVELIEVKEASARKYFDIKGKKEELKEKSVEILKNDFNYLEEELINDDVADSYVILKYYLDNLQ